MLTTDQRYTTGAWPYAMLMAASLVFASNHIIGRYVHGSIPPMGMAFWRMTIGGLVILPFVGRELVMQWPLLRRHWWLFLVLGIAFVPLGNGLIYLAYNYTTAMNGGVVSATTPALPAHGSASVGERGCTY